MGDLKGDLLVWSNRTFGNLSKEIAKQRCLHLHMENKGGTSD